MKNQARGLEALLGPATNAGSLRRFARATGERGPHLIPRHRQVANPCHRVHSVKAGNRILVTESGQEADAVYRAEGNPDVISICEQPYRIHEPFGSGPYYTFDLGFTYRDGREVLYEVKPVSQFVEGPDGRMLPKDWHYIEDWCRLNGKECGVITDEDLTTDYRLTENWRYLLPFVRIAKEHPNPLLEAEILKICRDAKSILFLELVESVPAENASYVQAAVAHLLHQGLLVADLNEIDAGPQMVIRAPGRG